VSEHGIEQEPNPAFEPFVDLAAMRGLPGDALHQVGHQHIAAEQAAWIRARLPHHIRACHLRRQAKLLLMPLQVIVKEKLRRKPG
jgi:hypothetical protein